MLQGPPRSINPISPRISSAPVASSGSRSENQRWRCTKTWGLPRPWRDKATLRCVPIDPLGGLDPRPRVHGTPRQDGFGGCLNSGNFRSRSRLDRPSMTTFMNCDAACRTQSALSRAFMSGTGLGAISRPKLLDLMVARTGLDLRPQHGYKVPQRAFWKNILSWGGRQHFEPPTPAPKAVS